MSGQSEAKAMLTALAKRCPACGAAPQSWCRGPGGVGVAKVLCEARTHDAK